MRPVCGQAIVDKGVHEWGFPARRCSFVPLRKPVSERWAGTHENALAASRHSMSGGISEPNSELVGLFVEFVITGESSINVDLKAKSLNKIPLRVRDLLRSRRSVLCDLKRAIARWDAQMVARRVPYHILAHVECAYTIRTTFEPLTHFFSTGFCC